MLGFSGRWKLQKTFCNWNMWEKQISWREQFMDSIFRRWYWAQSDMTSPFPFNSILIMDSDPSQKKWWYIQIIFFYLGGGKSAIAGLGLLCLSFKRISEKNFTDSHGCIFYTVNLYYLYIRKVTITCISGKWHSQEQVRQQPKTPTPPRPANKANKVNKENMDNHKTSSRENFWKTCHLQRPKEDAPQLFRSQLLQLVAQKWRWRGTN